MRTIDVTAHGERFLKALVYGAPGTGKTNFGVSAPRPLILLSELQAVPHVRAAAKRLGVAPPAVLAMESLDDYRHVLRALCADKAQPFVVRDAQGGEVLRLPEWPLSVVLDSLTDACQLVSDEIRVQSPPRIGKDGLPVDSERYWNVLKERAMKLIRAFRDVPLNVLFLALLDDRTVGEGDEQVRVVGPSLPMRALPAAVQAAVNVVGVTYRKRAKTPDANGERPYEYGIATAGPDYFALKPCTPLREYEVTDYSSWCARINGIEVLPDAPPPMDDPAQASPAGDVTAEPAKHAETAAAPEQVAEEPAKPTRGKRGAKDVQQEVAS